MKKRLLGLFLTAIAFTAAAQPQLTGNWCFQLGVTGSNVVYGAPSFTVPSGGANQTWNYSNLTTGTTLPVNLMPPAQLPAPYNTGYPAGTTQATYNDVNGDDQVMYMKKTSSSYGILGLSASGVTLEYSPQLLEASFPMNLGDSDTEDCVITVNGTDIDATQTVTYMGYGTLTTPTGTYQNCILIRGDQEYDLNPGTIASTYTWYKPGFAFLLRAAAGNGGSTISYANSTIPTSVDENGVAVSIDAFPNPATDVLFVSSPLAKYSLKVYSATGALVAEEDVDNSDKKAYAVDLNSLSPGMYLLNVNANGATTAKRFVKL
ncbi:MAG: T9SS type A sorting domain-containing protein [Sphingobacteriales bacterium JAD_PAG50586_3]|nr:MAG: T9SS type A sorting domain-containing protein [Sphingobacteriales bacterium JAD_PAG50586_3]